MEIDINNNDAFYPNLSDEILPTLINVKASICTSLFGKNKFKEPIDALVFGDISHQKRFGILVKKMFHF